MKNTIKRIYAFIGVLAVTFSAFIGNVLTAKAEAVTNFDNVSVMEDLKAMPNFSTSDYPKIELKDGDEPWVQVIQCSEYCYSEYGVYDDFYGLYLYVYNPSETAVYPAGHYVNMATGYDEAGEPTAYKNWALELLSSYSNRFLKFKVKDYNDLRKQAKAYATSHEGVRRYDIAGVQVSFVDFYELDERYGRTYYFSGFGKGMSPATETESTLACTSDYLDAIELDVNHTYYRSDFKNNVADELSTVYFSISDEVFETYGNKLQKIKAEWYEYKSNPIFVTSDNEAYNALYTKIGQEIGTKCEGFNWRVLWGKTEADYLGYHELEYSYNGWIADPQAGVWGVYNWTQSTAVERMDWLFKVSEVGDKDRFRVSSETLKAWMEEYTENHPNQDKVDTLGTAKYAEGLFTTALDDTRRTALGDSLKNGISGHVEQEIDADDTGTFLFEKNQNAWNKFWFGAKYDETTYSPIVVIEDETELSYMTADSFAETYYVNKADAPAVLQYCKNELNAGRKPVLFRFAQTDYYAGDAYFDYHGNNVWSEMDGYVAQETMFLGFDVISLTFRKDNNTETVLAVVSDPTDIINTLDPSAGIGDNFDIIEFIKNVLLFVGITSGCVVTFLVVKKFIK